MFGLRSVLLFWRGRRSERKIVIRNSLTRLERYLNLQAFSFVEDLCAQGSILANQFQLGRIGFLGRSRDYRVAAWRDVANRKAPIALGALFKEAQHILRFLALGGDEIDA